MNQIQSDTRKGAKRCRAPEEQNKVANQANKSTINVADTRSAKERGRDRSGRWAIGRGMEDEWRMMNDE